MNDNISEPMEDEEFFERTDHLARALFDLLNEAIIRFRARDKLRDQIQAEIEKAEEFRDEAESVEAYHEREERVKSINKEYEEADNEAASAETEAGNIADALTALTLDNIVIASDLLPEDIDGFDAYVLKMTNPNVNVTIGAKTEATGA